MHLLKENDPNVDRGSTASIIVLDNLCCTDMLKERDIRKKQTTNSVVLADNAVSGSSDGSG